MLTHQWAGCIFERDSAGLQLRNLKTNKASCVSIVVQTSFQTLRKEKS